MTQLNVGDRVTLAPARYNRASGDAYPRTLQVESRDALVVTRVYSSSFTARGYILPGGEEGSIRVYGFDSIVTVNGVDPGTGTAPRKLGEKPDDTDEMAYIGVDHPGIQWLFEDMGKYADNRSWCADYDRLARELGIPGRPRDRSVSIVIEGVTVSSVINAGSDELAEAELRRRLASFTG